MEEWNNMDKNISIIKSVRELHSIDWNNLYPEHIPDDVKFVDVCAYEKKYGYGFKKALWQSEWCVNRYLSKETRHYIGQRQSLKSVFNGIKRAILNKKYYIYQTDIKSFYRSISPELVRRLFGRPTNSNRMNMFNGFMNVIEDEEFDKFFYHGKSLIPGYPHAGMIAMLVSNRIYHILKNTIGVHDYTDVFGYADDFIFMTNDKKRIKNIKYQAKRLLGTGLEWNKEKSRTIDLTKEAPIILGMRIIADHPNIIQLPRNKWKKVKKKPIASKRGYVSYMGSFVDKNHSQFRKLKSIT
jgi:hypothetical protein